MGAAPFLRYRPSRAARNHPGCAADRWRSRATLLHAREPGGAGIVGFGRVSGEHLDVAARRAALFQLPAGDSLGLHRTMTVMI